jgi:hypothetical protein
MHRLSALAFALGTLLAVGAFAKDPPDARVTAVSGEVMAYTGKGTFPATVGMQLYRGDQVATVNGTVDVQMTGSSHPVHLEPYAMMVVLHNNPNQDYRRETAASTRLECQGGPSCTQLRNALSALAGRPAPSQKDGQHNQKPKEPFVKVKLSAASKREQKAKYDSVKGKGKASVKPAKAKKDTAKKPAKPAKSKKTKPQKTEQED